MESTKKKEDGKSSRALLLFFFVASLNLFGFSIRRGRRCVTQTASGHMQGNNLTQSGDSFRFVSFRLTQGFDNFDAIKVRIPPFSRDLLLTSGHLQSQARANHRENSKKRGVFRRRWRQL
jgi:hypothetical protein